MLLSTFAIYNLNFGVVFTQKYPSECHICHMRMAQIEMGERGMRSSLKDGRINTLTEFPH